MANKTVISKLLLPLMVVYAWSQTQTPVGDTIAVRQYTGKGITVKWEAIKAIVNGEKDVLRAGYLNERSDKQNKYINAK